MDKKGTKDDVNSRQWQGPTKKVSLSRNSAAMLIVDAAGQTLTPAGTVAGLKPQPTTPVDGFMLVSSRFRTMAMSASSYNRGVELGS